jgi:putative endonuclease
MFFAYLLANRPHGTLYVGMTDDLLRRIWEHKTKSVAGFTAKYGVDRLVWFEAHETLESRCCGRNRSRSGGAPGKSN